MTIMADPDPKNLQDEISRAEARLSELHDERDRVSQRISELKAGVLRELEDRGPA